MGIEIGETQEEFNTQYAPLAAILATLRQAQDTAYQAKRMFQPLENIEIGMKSRDFTPTDKLIQVLISIVAGCETLSEVNLRCSQNNSWQE